MDTPMKISSFLFYIVGAFVLISLICTGQDAGSGRYPDPKRFEAEIQRFESQDRDHMPPAGAIVCTGSSSMRMWSDSIRADLAPLTVIPRGFGGSNMNDLLYYTGRIVLRYKPRAVVVYEGDNDIAQGISPEKITETFRAFIRVIHNKIPECRIYFLSVKPSLARLNLWPEMNKTNRLIAAVCNGDSRLIYVDVASGMMDEHGTPRKDIFREDGLHMNRQGYRLWKAALKPVLMKTELKYEPGSDRNSFPREFPNNGVIHELHLLTYKQFHQ